MKTEEPLHLESPKREWRRDQWLVYADWCMENGHELLGVIILRWDLFITDNRRYWATYDGLTTDKSKNLSYNEKRAWDKMPSRSQALSKGHNYLQEPDE